MTRLRDDQALKRELVDLLIEGRYSRRVFQRCAEDILDAVDAHLARAAAN